MQLPKPYTIISWMIIGSTVVLAVIVVMTWKITNDTKARVQQDYEVFQKDIFQQSVFLGRSVSTLQQLIHYGQDPKSHPLTKKELGVYLRAVLGHQDINMQLYAMALERLPEKDPLSIADQITQLRSRIEAHVGHILALSRDLDEAPDTDAIQALVVDSLPELQGFIDVLNGGLDVHSQVESTYFKMLKDGNAKAIETITFSLNALIGLMAAIIVLTVFYLAEQRRTRDMLKAAYEDLEVKVNERTRELREANVELSKAQHIENSF